MAELDRDLDDDLDPIEYSSLSEDDYNEEVARRKKAEEKWVLPTKQLMKELGVKDFDELRQKVTNGKDSGLTEEKLALREEINDFLSDNKDLKEYKADLLKYREQGFSLKQAVAVIENDDATIENRKKANLSLSGGESNFTTKSSYTRAEVEKMSKEQFSKIKEGIFTGKIQLK